VKKRAPEQYFAVGDLVVEKRRLTFAYSPMNISASYCVISTFAHNDCTTTMPGALLQLTFATATGSGLS